MARKKQPAASKKQPAASRKPRAAAPSGPAKLPDAFYTTLETNPGDTFTIKALADWYEEQGQADPAACLRWAADNGRWPYRYLHDGSLTKSCDSWNKRWLWWAKEDPDYGDQWGHPASCRLPAKAWKLLAHTFDYSPAVFKEYPTMQGAWEALFAVWPKARRTLAPSRKSKS
jgi:hypothetical protein